MRIKTVEIMVGLFMVAGFACLVVLALKVSGLAFDADGDSYKLYAHFDNIGGLTIRSKVGVAGVTVGEVTAITLDQESLSGRVEMEIDGRYRMLTTDTSASILTAGLLGGNYIGLVSGADEEFLQAGDLIEDTQSALVLEELIGQFLFNKVNE